MKKTKTLGLTPRGKIVDAVVPGLLQRGNIYCLGAETQPTCFGQFTAGGRWLRYNSLDGFKEKIT